MCHIRFKRKLFASCGLAACVLALLFGASGTWSASETRLHLPVIFENWAPPTPSSTDQLLITELLIDAVLEPGGEWFELYNPNPGPLELTYYKVGDEETFGGGEGMFQFPFGTQLRPGGVIVVAHQATTFQATYGFLPDYELRESLPQVPNMLKYAAWATGSIELVNSGDDLLVLNSLDSQVDAVSWGSSLYAFSPSAPKTGQDQSLARHSVCLDSDTASDWVVRAEPSPGRVEACPLPASATATVTAVTPGGPAVLWISEVMYDPLAEQPGGEWIEVLNAGAGPAELGGYKLGDEESQGGGEGMHAFPAGTWLQPGEVLVIAHKAVVFRSLYGFAPDFELLDTDPAVPDLARYPAWGQGTVNLSASGDDVLLLDPGDQVSDAVSWGTSRFAFDPSVSRGPAGSSLERDLARGDTDTATDWHVQALPNPGQVSASPPVATATASTTPTISATVTATASNIPPGTATGTPTASQTVISASATATYTAQPTCTPTASATASATTTATLSATASATTTSTPAATPTATPSATATATPGDPAVLVINELHADPHAYKGDANGDGVRNSTDDEFIELVNAGGSGIDISGWTLSDLVKTRHTFPPGSYLLPGCGLVVFGGGTPTGSFGACLVQVASTGTLALNNDGDTLSLRDASGALILQLTYGAEGGDDQSLTRDPDWSGDFVKHSQADGSFGNLFSPGTRLDGVAFHGCPAMD